MANSSNQLGPLWLSVGIAVAYSIYSLAILKWWFAQREKLPGRIAVLLKWAIIGLILLVPMWILSWLQDHLKGIQHLTPPDRLLFIFIWFVSPLFFILIQQIQQGRREHVLLADFNCASDTVTLNPKKRDGFMSKLMAYRRRLWRSVFELLVLYISAFIMIGMVARHIIQNGTDPRNLILAAIAIAALPILLIYALILPEWNRSRLGLICPVCRSSLVETSHVVMTTGRCGACGAQII